MVVEEIRSAGGIAVAVGGNVADKESAVAMIEGAGLAVPKILADAASNAESGRFFNHPQINRGRFFVAG